MFKDFTIFVLWSGRMRDNLNRKSWTVGMFSDFYYGFFRVNQRNKVNYRFSETNDGKTRCFKIDNTFSLQFRYLDLFIIQLLSLRLFANISIGSPIPLAEPESHKATRSSTSVPGKTIPCGLTTTFCRTSSTGMEIALGS